MVSVERRGSAIAIETPHLAAEVHTEGYVSGVAGGSFVDKATGARDCSFGLDIVDFLLEPGWPEEGDEGEAYSRDRMVHGDLPKRYVELPQICTQARRLEAEIVAGPGFAAVKQAYRYREATRGRQAGSLWEQVLVFPEEARYFVSMDRITSVNAVAELTLRIDLPGHLKHDRGDSFEQVYLSYEGFIPRGEFLEDFPPDARFLYQRGARPLPERMIRARQHRVGDRPGPWLAGMTLDPQMVSEAWCHQRGYVCFIEEIGRVPVAAGGQFSAAHLIGYFDSVPEMERVFDRYAGCRELIAEPEGWELRPGR
ncbi:MAG: hypothetical protein ABIL09_29200 [Gemmatimonadota bacterium]